MKEYTFGGQKGKNKPSEPKYEIWGPKSIWPCDISIDQEFYMEYEKIYFRRSKWQKKNLWSPKTEFEAKISKIE
jgi:hypothetical protein